MEHAKAAVKTHSKKMANASVYPILSSKMENAFLQTYPYLKH
jgi:hypothetical protein